MTNPALFLKKVWSLQGGEYFFITTKTVKGGRWKEHTIKAPVTVEKVRRLIESNGDKHLYFCPVGFNRPFRKREYAVETSFLWSDLDEADPGRCKPIPQIAWQTSPKRFSSLWLLNDPIDPREAEEINRTLTYSNGADKSGWDLTQVLRIPGTINYKYVTNPRGKILWFKDNEYPIGEFPDVDTLEDLDPVKVLRDVRRKMKPETFRLLTADKATKGKRSEIIWRLENELSEQGLTPDEIFCLIKSSVWNKFAGRRDEDSQLKRELSKVNSKPKSIARQKEPIKLVQMSTVEPEVVDWLWFPYIPIGKVTLVEGDPGLGKSWFTMALTSYMSQRKKLPEQSKANGGKVLIMSAEDGLGDTIRPRLDSLGATVRNIFAIDSPVVFDEEGVEEVAEYIKDIRPKLVVIDPLVAYMGGNVDLHRANETRAVMARLARIAEEYSVAIVAVRHLTKGNRDKSIYRGLGSIDITASARSVLMIGRNPDDPNESRVVCHIKSNLAPLGRPISYSLSPGSVRPFQWNGPVDYTVDEVFRAEAVPGKGEYEMALDFLREALDEGGVLADDVRRDAEAKGISLKNLRKARGEIGVVAKHTSKGVLWCVKD